MLQPNEAARRLRIPAGLLDPTLADEPPLAKHRRKRDFARRMGTLVSLNRGGRRVVPIFVDAQGQEISNHALVSSLRAATAAAVRELHPGRAAHARRTLAAVLDATIVNDGKRVDGVLRDLYLSHARGTYEEDTIDAFLDTFEGWLKEAGVAKVDLVFDRLDLDRIPPKISTLLLALTRVSRASFGRRDAFVERVRVWLTGRDGRTPQDVERILRGLRE